jgi:hypothetical protein
VAQVVGRSLTQVVGSRWLGLAEIKGRGLPAVAARIERGSERRSQDLNARDSDDPEVATAIDPLACRGRWR